MPRPTTKSIGNSAGTFRRATTSASTVCDRWAASDPDRARHPAHAAGRPRRRITFGWLRETSNRLANVLRANGIARGDRVAIFLPQAPEVAAAHIAIYKLGGVALPIAVLFGPDALTYRLQNSGAKALITNAQGLAKLDGIRDEAAGASRLSSTARATALGFADLLARASSDFTPDDTSADDPAMMIYTSGTTGQPKGALHGHRVLLGHLPGVELPHYPFPQAGRPVSGRRPIGPGPADCSTCCCRACITACRSSRAAFEKFDPEEAFALMAKARRAQRLHPADRAAHDARGAEPARPLQFQFAQRSAPAASRSASRRWTGAARRSASPSTSSMARPNAIWCSAPARRSACSSPARSARRCPAIRSAVIDADGEPVKPGELGQIAVKRPDPVMFLEYWGKPGGDAGQIHRRLDDDRRSGRHRRGRLHQLRRPRRRCDHLGRLPHRARRDRGLPHRAIRPSRSPPRSASRTRCAPRSSRRSSC